MKVVQVGKLHPGVVSSAAGLVDTPVAPVIGATLPLPQAPSTMTIWFVAARPSPLTTYLHSVLRVQSNGDDALFGPSKAAVPTWRGKSEPVDPIGFSAQQSL